MILLVLAHLRLETITEIFFDESKSVSVTAYVCFCVVG